MKSLDELLNLEEPAWPLVQGWLAQATNPVEVLPARDEARTLALLQTQVTTRSPLGAIIYETGGLLIDHGWIRVLGSGHERLPRTLPGWNHGRSEGQGFCLIADDVIGGFFAIDGGSLGSKNGEVCYLAPDTLEWEPLERGYSETIYWFLTGNLAGFYQDYRWPGWEQEVAALPGERGFALAPPPCCAGAPLAERLRGAVPLAELYGLHAIELPRQLLEKNNNE